MAVSVFDYAAFSALFPELVAGGVTEPIATALFGVAGLMLDNTDCSIVPDPAVRLTFLNYIVAHLASVSGYPVPAGGSAAPSGIVGRISSATEGTVSVASELAGVTNAQAWWMQSQYGATFWQLTRGLRTMQYRGVAPRYFGPAALAGGRFGYPFR